MRFSRPAILGPFVFMASAGLAFGAQPAAELPDQSLVPLVANFVQSCMKDFDKDKALGSFYCPCAGAVVVDRLSVEELTKDEAMTFEAMEAAHPGIGRLLKVCGLAAKAGTK
jgi:hypothetical protein